MKIKNLILLSLLLFLTINILVAQELMKCPVCNKVYSVDYSYCPFDGNKLIPYKMETKDIAGFQEYKWGMTIDKVKIIIGELQYEIDDSNKEFIIITVPDFKFQSKNALLKLEFYRDKLFKVSVHFIVGANTAGMNEYFSMAGLLKEIYGNSEKIAIGPESNDYNHRVTQISIGDLSYQFKWDSVSGKLTFQLSNKDYETFICSLFYTSKDSDEIDKQKAKSEF